MNDEKPLQSEALNHLPAIFQSGATVFDESSATGDPTTRGQDDPLSAILVAWQKAVRGIERVIEALEYYADPGSTPPNVSSDLSPGVAGARPNGEAAFLAYLATWVKVDLSRVDVDETRTAGPGLLEQRQRWLVGHAADLYRQRGTVTGLKRTLEAYYDIAVDVHEWAWPQGLRIGMSSAIGVDTVLLPETDRRRAFVVVWQAPDELKKDLKQWRLRVAREPDAPHAWAAATVVRAQAPNKAGRWVDDPHWDISRGIRGRVQRIRAAIDRERPAHTHCYFALGWDESPPTWPSRDVMRIEVRSRIGEVWIESRRKSDGVSAH